MPLQQLIIQSIYDALFGICFDSTPARPLPNSIFKPENSFAPIGSSGKRYATDFVTILMMMDAGCVMMTDARDNGCIMMMDES